MFRVRVHKIMSLRDLDGNLGKRIELIQQQEIPHFALTSQTQEAKVVQNVLQAVQEQMPMFSQAREIITPKIILFFTEHEYEGLGINFEVNQIYEITLKDRTIKFQHTHRG